MRFIEAARITAWPGDSTFVATTVAIELAVSWKPLMNSKTSANTTTSRTRVSMLILLGILLFAPVPLTNYPFGLLLLGYAFALIERDGKLMLLCWILGLFEILEKAIDRCRDVGNVIYHVVLKNS